MSAAPIAHLAKAVAGSDGWHLQPLAFFQSWSGVLTLAMRELPPPADRAKASLAAAAAALPPASPPASPSPSPPSSSSPYTLPPEFPGSLWPKITLAAGEAETSPVSVADVARMVELSADFRADLAKCPPLPISTLALVHFQSRSLEKLAARVDAPLAAPPADPPAGGEPSPLVARVLGEWDDVETYHGRVVRSGNRATHYRDAAHGATCVTFLADCGPAATDLLAAVRAFREAVDREWPGRYCWMPESSLHITLRGL